MRGSLLTLALLLGGTSSTLAEEAEQTKWAWAKKMFDHTSHDFGVVARGQKVEHRFPLQNKYQEDMVINAIRSTCRCLKPKATKQTLKMLEKGEIVVTVDTRRFLGRKDGTLKVIFGGQFPAEVQLHCYVYIRSDVVIQPGEVRFGSVPHGTGLPAKKVCITYAGRSDWEIVRADCENPHLDLQLAEKGRSSGEVTQVTYDLMVGLKADAPVGYVRDHVVLTTNDQTRNATRLLVPVEGIVAPTVSARPSPLMLGLLKPGQEVSCTILVRGKSPFRIVDVSGPDEGFQFKWTDAAKTWHVVPVTFTAARQPGKISGIIRIRTDVAGSEVVEVKFDGRVIAPSAETSPEDSSDVGVGRVPAGESRRRG